MPVNGSRAGAKEVETEEDAPYHCFRCLIGYTRLNVMVSHFLYAHPGLNPFEHNDPPGDFLAIRGPYAHAPPYEGLEFHRNKFEDTEECSDSASSSRTVATKDVPVVQLEDLDSEPEFIACSKCGKTFALRIQRDKHMSKCNGLSDVEKLRATKVEVVVEKYSDKSTPSLCNATLGALHRESKERTRQNKRLKTDNHRPETERAQVDALQPEAATIAQQSDAATIAQQPEAAHIVQHSEPVNTAQRTETATAAQHTESTEVANHGQDMRVALNIQGKKLHNSFNVNRKAFLHQLFCQFQMVHPLFPWIIHYSFRCNLPMHTIFVQLQLICRHIWAAFVWQNNQVLRT